MEKTIIINNQEIDIETISFMELNNIVENTNDIECLKNANVKISELKIESTKNFNYEKASLYRDFECMITHRVNFIKHKK